ncbi:type IV pili twitching motility protein PilT [Candidatus Daviesbacteria bacterium RIFCSPLOWO2_02_FULL_41_8]|uniref:Type IV pili twitching motility protein PilT n=2 Tax=Candidatus Daviesiibacteriota TaxID=1752718 RepID=A0A1F5NIE6_9BACT|nr:MAG: type IV pili twitching motility protein PilT [Candidatus Daviesbacteria bacterium RIFCSPHIGHO2_01_FULL_41_23]OGE62441.1 MAG: type IV pili twitching motility protein PilT [Candidatus Daviesbacteria bacterium RIFCSPLOWO2_01_FULL_41_32]OGE77324.1 MAG: type IV pili twitching motility protein PilT [Candidatus Daviesbacteria bacterium RIFCSPLOWO2_02_FULL_41_8]
MNIQQLFNLTIQRNASDLHLSVGFPPMLRIHGELLSIPGEHLVTPEQIESLIKPLLTSIQVEIYNRVFELDFSFEFEGRARFRVNLFRQKGYSAAAMRLIPNRIPMVEELGLPQSVNSLIELKQGFILVTGPTGHGKSTTLASFINQINKTRAAHIITVEDPIEYVYPPGKSLIEQREMYSDTKTWGNALRSALREDPDVVLIGEMRDLETIASAMTIAETGHLVFATLHTNSAAQSVDRIIDVFPEIQQPQIRLQLASTLEAIISLRLVPTIEPGRTLASEVLFATPAVRNIIREGKSYLIDNTIETSAELGMQPIERSLADLVKGGRISQDVAIRFSMRPELLNKLL